MNLFNTLSIYLRFIYEDEGLFERVLCGASPASKPVVNIDMRNCIIALFFSKPQALYY